MEDLERNPCWCLEISLYFKKKLSMANAMILSMILQKILVSEISLLFSDLVARSFLKMGVIIASPQADRVWPTDMRIRK